MFIQIRRGLKLLALMAATIAPLAATAASMTVTFSPSTAATSTAVAANINYAGVAATGNGTQVVACYDATKLTFVSVAYANPPGESNSSQDQLAGVLCVAPATRQVSLNWISIGGTWPSNPTASGTLAPSGALATINFTTAATFSGSTSVVATENTARGGNYALGTATGTLSLFVPPTSASFTSSPSALTFAEGGAPQDITVTCSGSIGTPSPVVINVASSNTAFFTVAAPTLSFTTCPSSQTVAVTPRAADAGFNPTQTGTVTFSTATTGATAPPSVGVTVNDNQSPAVYTVTKTTATVTEGSATTDTLTVTCTGAFTGGLTSGSVQYGITGGLTNPGDITTPALTGMLNFAACGGATQSVTISPRANDVVVQGTRSGTFTISTPVGGTLGAVTTGSITVNDDDAPPAITISVAGSPATEAGGVLTYTVTRAGGSAGQLAAPLTVNLTSPSGSRFNPAPATTCGATITILANALSATCTVTGLDNSVVDGPVNAVVTIAAPLGGAYTGTGNSATGIITDNDLAVTVTPTNVIEGGTATFSVACSLAGASVTGLTFTVSGLDPGKTPTPAGPALGTLTCGTPIVISVPTTDDTVIGNSRSLVLTLTGPGASSTGGTVVLPSPSVAGVSDNDAPLVVPTMSAAALGLLALLIFGFVAFGQRRRVD